MNNMHVQRRGPHLTVFPTSSTLPPTPTSQEETKCNCLRQNLPPLYSQTNAKDPTVHAKFFCPWNNWTWFATEAREDNRPFLFFGYVIATRKSGAISPSLKWRKFAAPEA